MGRPFKLEDTKIEQPDDDRLWIRIGKFDVRLVHTDEGIVVDIYPFGDDYAGEPIATTYAFDVDADEALSDEDTDN